MSETNAPQGETSDSDPAEQSSLMRLFYRSCRPTRLGRLVNRLQGWWAGSGLPPTFQVLLEVRGRRSGEMRANPVVVATVEGKRYLVSMLGPGSEWVKNVDVAGGKAVIKHGKREPIRRASVAAPPERAAILREYVRIASSGRAHFPVPKGAPLAEFEAIADRYPVYRVDPA